MKTLELFAAATAVTSLAVMHGLGWRAHACFLSGTIPAPGLEAIPLGIAYVVMWFVVVLLVPILVLGVGIDALVARRHGQALR